MSNANGVWTPDEVALLPMDQEGMVAKVKSETPADKT
jgi:hypothetical protein